jgi:aspartokinase
LALLQAFAAAGISLFLIKLHPNAISFAARADAVEGCERLLKERQANYWLLRDLGLVATVAGAMRDLSGVMARIYETMVAEGIRVRQTGDAYNAVLCLVAGDEADRAAAALQRAFSLTEVDGPPARRTGPDEGVSLKAL